MLVSKPSRKDKLVPVSILHTFIPPIQNNPPHFSPLPSLSYNFPSLLSLSVPKKPIIEVEEVDNINSNVEMQSLSSQWPLQPVLQTPQEGPKLRRSKYQTQILFEEENIYWKWEKSTNIQCNPL